MTIVGETVVRTAAGTIKKDSARTAPSVLKLIVAVVLVVATLIVIYFAT